MVWGYWWNIGFTWSMRSSITDVCPGTKQPLIYDVSLDPRLVECFFIKFSVSSVFTFSMSRLDISGSEKGELWRWLRTHEPSSKLCMFKKIDWGFHSRHTIPNWWWCPGGKKLTQLVMKWEVFMLRQPLHCLEAYWGRVGSFRLETELVRRVAISLTIGWMEVENNDQSAFTIISFLLSISQDLLSLDSRAGWKILHWKWSWRIGTIGQSGQYCVCWYWFRTSYHDTQKCWVQGNWCTMQENDSWKYGSELHLLLRDQ